MDILKSREKPENTKLVSAFDRRVSGNFVGLEALECAVCLSDITLVEQTKLSGCSHVSHVDQA